MNRLSAFPRWRAALLLLVCAAAVLAAALLGPIPQPASYHAFADQRTLLGIPHFWNVVSSLPFTLLGLAGLWRLRGRPPGLLPELRSCYAACFAGAVLIGLGSGLYHLRPDNATLVWDRLPMAVTFMGFFAVVIGEHIDTRLARRALPWLLLAGVGSVAYWALSERLGVSDLRPYLLVQFLPMALIPMLLLLYPSRLSGVGWLWALLGLYGVAKVPEGLDALLFERLGGLSGHTLKHLVAAAGLGCLVLALVKRHPRPAGDDAGRPPLSRPARPFAPTRAHDQLRHPSFTLEPHRHRPGRLRRARAAGPFRRRHGAFPPGRRTGVEGGALVLSCIRQDVDIHT